MIATPARATTFTTAEVIAYLDRIGYEGPTTPTLETLNGIHHAHLFNVPFENLDILPLSRPLNLDPTSLYDKIVGRYRGGFCYELNGLLAAILRDLGYEVTIASVQFVQDEGALSPPFDHMALVVSTPDSPHQWLVDVGAGRTSFATPLPLLDGFSEFQAAVQRGFRLTAIDTRWQLDGHTSGEPWAPDYTFQLIPHVIDDFRDRCRFQEQHPESHFRQGPLCSLPTPNGRVTLSKTQLITTIGDTREERTLSDDEFDEVLRVTFGIDLSI
jgi:N-hydroxyarylamine O-acetyltransferase